MSLSVFLVLHLFPVSVSEAPSTGYILLVNRSKYAFAMCAADLNLHLHCWCHMPQRPGTGSIVVFPVDEKDYWAACRPNSNPRIFVDCCNPRLDLLRGLLCDLLGIICTARSCRRLAFTVQLHCCQCLHRRQYQCVISVKERCSMNVHR